jgi:hypothetical protein
MTSDDHRKAQIKILEWGLVFLVIWFVIFIAGVVYILINA